MKCDMKLWTIQDLDAYKQLMKDGVLYANEKYLWCEESLKYAYDWMASELEKKDKKPDGVHYPIWAWYQWQGKRKKRDLRNSCLLKRGSPGVQLEIEIPDEKVLLSDFSAYHCVLNGTYVCSSEEEDEQFKEWCALQDEESQIVQKIKDSWSGIFDLTKEDDNWLYGKNDKKSIQAVFWELRKDQVIWAREFIAR